MVEPSLHANDIDCATVRDIVRFIRKSQRFQWVFDRFMG